MNIKYYLHNSNYQIKKGLYCFFKFIINKNYKKICQIIDRIIIKVMQRLFMKIIDFTTSND